MSPVRVFKEGLDWLWECAEHNTATWCADWELAYESALGHAVMHHRRSPVVRLSEVRDKAGQLTHMMCCICFDFVPVADLWVCPHGETWDLCRTDGERQGCFCGSPQA